MFIFIDAPFEYLIHLYTRPCIAIPKGVFCMHPYDQVYDLRPFVKRRPEPESKRSRHFLYVSLLKRLLN